jgi:glutamate-ammonia-ligase adenylyltransferase
MDTLNQLLDGSPAAHAALTRMGLTDTAAAARHLQRMVGKGVAALMPYLAPALANCADADQALVNMERFSSGDHAAETFRQLAENPRAIEILVTIFAGSQFLTEILLRDPAQLETLTRRERLARQKSAEDYHTESLQVVQSLDFAAQLDALRRYQRGEILRIGASDLLDLYDLPALTGQLSNLADGLTRTCITCSSQSPNEADGFVVIAMGKLGGGEVNYSSDIDLLFLARDKAVDYLPLGQRLIEALSRMTPEGFMYRVDMRLRPWGRDGALVTSLPEYLTYLQRNAQLWEKQALLKARPIAGDGILGEEALKQIGAAIFGADLETVRTSVHAMKQRTEEILRSKGRDWGEVKLGAGSIRDVEFVVQFLQLAYGGDNPAVRDHTTLNALPRLTRAGLLTAHESRVLADGYIFLRTVEHYLQLMHYRQTYTLPSEPAAINLLARRLGFRGQEREQAREKFIERYSQHSTAIRRIYSKYVGGVDLPTSEIARVEPAPIFALQQHLARMEASYSATFSEEEILNHATLAGALDEKHLVFVAPLQVDGTWRVTVVAYDYLGELSLICGLMFAYGLDILDEQVFTYETVETKGEPEIPQHLRPRRTRTGRLILPKAVEVPHSTPSARRKLVDVFTVKPVNGATPDWDKYAEDLSALTAMMQSGQRREARSELAKRVGGIFREMGSANLRLYPIEIKIDNDVSPQHTVLHIQTADTVGFLYEFTNALAMTHINILRMVAQSSGQHANDLLYVTDENGQKITSPEKQRELRAAAVLIKHFTHLLPGSANPAQALIHFREFLAHLFERPNWPDELASVEHPEVLSNLTQILGISDFLWDDFMRMQYANLFPVVSDANALNSAKSRAQLQAELTKALQTLHPTPDAPRDDAPWRKALNEFKDREMFRIDMRHLLGYTQEFWDFSEELSDLAEVVVNTAYHLSAEDLRTVHGTPRLEDGSVSQMTVLALGKCGGRELGFASDIELLFIYAGNGQTDGPERIATSVFQEKVVSHFLGAIHARHEGIFQVDLQLRPYGKAGSMAVSLDAFKRYYAPEGPAWAYERQALVKMRPIAGDMTLGAQVCALRDDFVYNGAPFDITAMRAMRERQVRHLVTAGKFSAKYSPGGLVDIEYLVQGLQITHGGKNPALRQTNIRKAMAALREADILSEADYTRLRKAHTFLRWLIDSMRVVRGSAKDITIPPYGSEEFAFLARRLRYGNDQQRLRDDLLRYQTDVQEINLRVLV